MSVLEDPAAIEVPPIFALLSLVILFNSATKAVRWGGGSTSLNNKDCDAPDAISEVATRR